MEQKPLRPKLNIGTYIKENFEKRLGKKADADKNETRVMIHISPPLGEIIFNSGERKDAVVIDLPKLNFKEDVLSSYKPLFEYNDFERGHYKAKVLDKAESRPESSSESGKDEKPSHIMPRAILRGMPKVSSKGFPNFRTYPRAIDPKRLSSSTFYDSEYLVGCRFETSSLNTILFENLPVNIMVSGNTFIIYTRREIDKELIKDISADKEALQIMLGPLLFFRSTFGVTRISIDTRMCRLKDTTKETWDGIKNILYR